MLFVSIVFWLLARYIAMVFIICVVQCRVVEYLLISKDNDDQIVTVNIVAESAVQWLVQLHSTHRIELELAQTCRRCLTRMFLHCLEVSKKKINQDTIINRCLKIVSPPALGTLVHKDLQWLQGSLPTRLYKLYISKEFCLQSCSNFRKIGQC